MLEIITNNVPRDIVFQAPDWPGYPFSEHDEPEVPGVAYKGEFIPLGDFERRSDIPGWDGIRCDSFFSGVVIRLLGDGETAIVGMAYHKSDV